MNNNSTKLTGLPTTGCVTRPTGTELRFIRPTLPPPEEWVPLLAESYRQRVFTNFGPLATRLEHELAQKYGGGRAAILTANCTVGLTAALLALKATGPVVVPSFTFAATAQAVLQAQCEPLFCDVSLDTWEIDPECLESILRTRRVGAVICVRTFGFCRDLRPIEQLTRQFGVPLVVDAAAALGGLLPNGSPAGCQGEMEVFSLHATKVFGVGEGGLILARPEYETPLREIINFGLRQGDVAAPGCNGKFSEFHAAVGIALMNHIDAFIDRRHALARRYGIAFAHLPLSQARLHGARPAWQTFPLLAPPATDVRAAVDTAERAGVQLRRYYRPALHRTAFFQNLTERPLKRSEYLSDKMLCLPIYSDMADDEQQRIIEVVRACVPQPFSVLNAA